MFNLLAHAGESHEVAVAVTTSTHATESAGGLSVLGLNLQSFLFQLITFLIVLLILRKFVYKKLVATLEERRQTVEDSLKHAAATEAEMKKTEANIAKLMVEARKEASEIVETSHKEASQMIEAAEAKAVKRAEHIVSEAKAQIDVEIGKARKELKAEAAQLVALAAGQLIKEKIDASKDAKLIESALQKAEGQLNG